jgi:phenylacetate-CoA ligase
MSTSAKHRDLAEILSSCQGQIHSCFIWASTAYRYGWYGIDLNKSYQARFYGILWILLVTKKERIKDFLSNRFRLPVFDLSNPVLENFLGHFRTKNLIILTATLAQLFCSLNFTRQKH